MNLDALFPLIWTCLIVILVGIFLTPVIRDLISPRERQENHPPLDELIKQKERWLQFSGHHRPDSNVAQWRARFLAQSKILDDFIVWGDPELLTQLNRALTDSDSDFVLKVGQTQLLELLSQTPPAADAPDELVQALVVLVKNHPLET